jgi:hypothetical protein
MFYYQTTLGRLLRPLFQNFVLMNMRFSRFLLLKKGIVNVWYLGFRLIKINIFMMMLI